MTYRTYRAAHLLAMRPPLANGGHCLIPLDGDVWWCVGCHRALPGWALAEGFVTTLLGRWCPSLFRSLVPAP